MRNIDREALNDNKTHKEMLRIHIMDEHANEVIYALNNHDAGLTIRRIAIRTGLSRRVVKAIVRYNTHIYRRERTPASQRTRPVFSLQPIENNSPEIVYHSQDTETSETSDASETSETSESI